jgi:crotonobetainyl-CoA:carnitine CoA-transferase CaiB-like acyl-CoA transferase
MDDPWSVDHGLSVTRDHDGVGVMTHAGPAPRLSGSPLEPGRSTPEIGGQTFEILAELGLSDRSEEFAPALVMVGGQVDNG